MDSSLTFLRTREIFFADRRKSFTKSPLSPCAAAAAKQRGEAEEEDADAAARRAMREATVRNILISSITCV